MPTLSLKNERWPFCDRESLLVRLQAARQNFRSGNCVNDFDLQALCDGIRFLLGDPTLPPPRDSTEDPWDQAAQAQERDAIKQEPRSVYSYLRNPPAGLEYGRPGPTKSATAPKAHGTPGKKRLLHKS